MEAAGYVLDLGRASLSYGRGIGRFFGNGICPVIGGSSVPADACAFSARLRIAALYDIEANFENELQQLGAGAASTIAESFIATIIRVRREIEAAGAMPPPALN